MRSALANCLVAARGVDGLPLAGPNVPRLFSLDRRLHMPNGYDYFLARGQTGHRRMTGQGRGKGQVFFLERLAPSQLLAAGLVSPAAHDACVRQGESKSEGSCGAGCGGS